MYGLMKWWMDWMDKNGWIKMKLINSQRTPSNGAEARDRVGVIASIYL